MMKKRLRKHLEKKGWEEEEIRHAIETARRAEEKKTSFVHFVDRFLYYIFLLIIVLANVLVAALFVPLLMTLQGVIVWMTIILTGLVIGYFFDHLIRDLEHIDHKHHIFALIFLPLMAIINVVLLGKFANILITLLNISSPVKNVWLIAIVYAVVFIVPYMYQEVKERT